MGRHSKQMAYWLWPLILIFSPWGVANAQHSHEHGGKSAANSPKQSGQRLIVEGLKISLEIMSMGEHVKHMAGSKGHKEGASAQTHSLMVTLQDTFSKEIISDAQVKFTVRGPSGKKETGVLEWSGDHYGAGFSLQERGAYQVELAIATGGLEREARFSYEAK